MSGNGKRILPPSAATTSALIPISPVGLSGAAVGRSSPNEDLIDQLVGGLVQTDQKNASESRFFNQGSEYSAQDRIYSIDDEEIDEPPVPIPSTWRENSAKEEPSWIAEQLKASAYGFVIGLFVVIPAVMLLTGQAERLPSWQAVSAYAKATTVQLGLGDVFKPSKSTTDDIPARQPLVVGKSEPVTTTTASISPATRAEPATTPTSEQPATTPIETAVSNQSQTADNATVATANDNLADQTSTAQPGLASTAGATSASETNPTTATTNTATTDRGNQQVAAIAAPSIAAPDTSKPEIQKPATARRSAKPAKPEVNLALAQKTIRAGDMTGARVMLARLASKGDSEAIFVLAETFDPNVLAAWGTRGEEANPEKARMFYTMALAQGVEKAQPRIKALQ